VIAWLAACAVSEAPPALPEAPFVSGEAAALSELVAQLAFLEDAPAAALSGSLPAQLAGCQRTHGWSTWSCDEPGSAEAARGDAALLVGLPLGEGLVLARGGPNPGGARFDLELFEPTGFGSFLRAAEDGPGASVLEPEGAFLHARGRTAELDLAALVPEGSQADELFGLRSELFSATVLDGTWELAAWPPEGVNPAPRAAVALGVRDPDLAARAVGAMLDELVGRWPALSPTPFVAEGGSGGCLLDVNLLPELAPCWLVTDRAVVVGWNEASVRLGSAPVPTLVVDFVALAGSDALLHAALEPDVPHQPLAYPWERLTVDLGWGEGRTVGTLVLR